MSAMTGLILAMAELNSAKAIAAFHTLDFATCKMAVDPRYAGGCLVVKGLARN